jgi:hypothetical protein
MINPFKNPRHRMLFRIGYRTAVGIWRVQWFFARRYRIVKWHLSGKPIPEVGALVDYGTNGYGDGPAHWRVNSYMRVAPEPEVGTKDWIDEILFEAAQKCGPEKKRMQWCLPNEATHVALSGICGTIARISEIKVTGMVPWSEQALADEREHARRLGERHEMIF